MAGREGSNLRMAESKSGYITSDFNEHFEKFVESDPRYINMLADDSE
jgi:hypothetical protein